MKRIIIIFYTLLILIVSPQISSGSMRCSGDLVQIGDYACIVAKKCGNPDYKEIIRIGVKHQPKIEHWAYERYGLTWCLVFKDGKLFKIEWIKN